MTAPITGMTTTSVSAPVASAVPAVVNKPVPVPVAKPEEKGWWDSFCSFFSGGSGETTSMAPGTNVDTFQMSSGSASQWGTEESDTPRPEIPTPQYKNEAQAKVEEAKQNDETKETKEKQEKRCRELSAQIQKLSSTGSPQDKASSEALIAEIEKINPPMAAKLRDQLNEDKTTPPPVLAHVSGTETKDLRTKPGEFHTLVLLGLSCLA